MPDSVRLTLIRNDRAREDASRVKAAMIDSMASMHLNLGDEIVGYAMVAWGRDRNMQTGMCCGPGPIGPAMVPPLAQSALTQHVSFDTIEDSLNQTR